MLSKKYSFLLLLLLVCISTGNTAQFNDYLISADTVMLSDPNCMVFVKDSLGENVGEVGSDAAGITLYYEKASIIILPWIWSFTAHVALHELGHTMGLIDLNEEGLSINDKIFSTIIDGNIVKWEQRGDFQEDNLMHYHLISNDYKLRKRGVVSKYKEVKHKEYQWDCLQKVNNACANQKRDSNLP